MARALTYPGNQSFDPVTLEPANDVTKRRVELMRQNMPELFAGGASLLDVGSSKGLVSFLARDAYDEVIGYEVGEHAHAVAEATQRHHGLDHVRFIHEPFRAIEVSKFERSRTYDVVYAGSVHHHLVKDAVLHRAPWWLPLKKLAALAERILIIDGPLEFGNDYSLNAWAKQYEWDADEFFREYTPEAHAEAVSPQFRLVRGPLPNERGRQTLVFERAEPDMQHLVVADSDIRTIRTEGEAIPSNKARDEASVVRIGDVRYKFDAGHCGVQSDGVLMILNSLPDRFARTAAVLVKDGRRIGDMAQWIDGEPMDDLRKLTVPWLELNDALACIGLVEIHFKGGGDFVLRDDGRVIDVDVDMVNHYRNLPAGIPYLEKWENGVSRATHAFGEGMAARIAGNLNDEWVFRDALKELRHK